MRTRLTITMLLACALLACSMATQPDEPVEPTPIPPPCELTKDTSAPPPTGGPPTAGSAMQPYHGEQSIEERIANADTIVKARLSTTTSEVVKGTIEISRDYCYVALRFHLTVSEYLKGSGASSITAFTIQGYFRTEQEAENARPDIISKRVSTWDDREAIIFLNSDDPNDDFSAAVQGANDYFLTIGATYNDWYSLHSPYSKLWLPSAATTATGDDQEFLLAVPGSVTPAITIRELKSRIAAVDAEMNAGDGSEAYRNCVRYKYRNEREDQHARSEGGPLTVRAAFDTHSLVSGSSAGTVIFRIDMFGSYPDTKTQTTLEGGHAALFETVDGSATPDDWNRDGVLADGIDFIRYTQSLRAVRPIPAGEYSFTVKDLPPHLIPCNAFLVYEWTVTANAPDGVLHEAFFDPVTVGSAVAADATNGTLQPRSFTDTNGAFVTIERIAWESGTAKVTLSPHTGIADHAVDFIAMDGSVSLSLHVADATVDAATRALTWPVPTQPWHSGDKLMVRIRWAPDCSVGAVPDASANPGLALDCETLLVVMDRLRGTATLNWDVSSAMATWDGVTVGGSPSRVTRLELANQGLDGNIPEYLGRLLGLTHLDLSWNSLTGCIPAELGLLPGLTHLDLSRNSLTGGIPAELGRLANLEALWLFGNSLTGCIPGALIRVARNDLSSLNLRYCRPPTPENLTVGMPTRTSIPLSWNAVTGAGDYHVEYRSSSSTGWTDDPHDATATTHVVDGLTCGTDYHFRVRALGVWNLYESGWGAPSAVLTATTAACP